MEKDRRHRYLETFLQGRAPSSVRELVPLVSRWHEVLSEVPGLRRRHPGTHSRAAGLSGGVLTVEADHPAWLQLLQWHGPEITEALRRSFPELGIRALQFRLSRPGEAVERPTVVMPDPVKPELTPEETAARDAILDELTAMIRKKAPDGGKSD